MNCSLSRYFSCNHQKHFQAFRLYSSVPHAQINLLGHGFEVDEKYLKNEANQKAILQNIQLRDIKDDYLQLFREDITSDELSNELILNAKSLPNTIHPVW